MVIHINPSTQSSNAVYSDVLTANISEQHVAKILAHDALQRAKEDDPMLPSTPQISKSVGMHDMYKQNTSVSHDFGRSGEVPALSISPKGPRTSNKVDAQHAENDLVVIGCWGVGAPKRCRCLSLA